jgi:hypothetical protein
MWGHMRDLSSRAEHYRKLAVKYHELAKSAPYLGDFYRGVAVRYVFMAQEASTLADRELDLLHSRATRPPMKIQGSQDLDTLALWAGACLSG